MEGALSEGGPVANHRGDGRIAPSGVTNVSPANDQWALALERPLGHFSETCVRAPAQKGRDAMPLYCFRTLDSKGNLVEKSESELEDDAGALIRGHAIRGSRTIEILAGERTVAVLSTPQKSWPAR